MSQLTDILVIETMDVYGFSNRVPARWPGEDSPAWTPYPLEIGDLPNFERGDRSDGLAGAKGSTSRSISRSVPIRTAL